MNTIILITCLLGVVVDGIKTKGPVVQTKFGPVQGRKNEKGTTTYVKLFTSLSLSLSHTHTLLSKNRHRTPFSTHAIPVTTGYHSPNLLLEIYDFVHLKIRTLGIKRERQLCFPHINVRNLI